MPNGQQVNEGDLLFVLKPISLEDADLPMSSDAQLDRDTGKMEVNRSIKNRR